MKQVAGEMASLSTQMEIISVMLPQRVRYLRDIPKLLQDIGIKTWILNPLMRIGSRKSGNFADKISSIFADVEELHHLAESHGVRLAVDDDLGLLRELSWDSNISTPASLRSIPLKIIPVRLAPGGHCSVGRGIAQPVTTTSARWVPGDVLAADFIQSLVANKHDIAFAA